MRDFIQKYGYIIMGVALACSVIVFLATRRKPISEGSTALAFFVDESDLTHESVRPNTDYPPIIENGRTLVQAVKRSEDEGKTVYIAFLLKYSPEVKQALKRDNPAPDPNFSMVQANGTLVRSPKPGSPWIKATDPEAEALMKLTPNSSGKMPLTIFPSR